MIRVLLLLLLLTAPDFKAQWASDHSATIAWDAPGRACLSVRHASGEGVFLGCWEGPARITLGGPLTDGSARPGAHDVFFLQTGGQVFSAPLKGRNVYLPVIR